ncbi:DUF1349 domain-containing protein [Microbacterium sp. 179-I 3D2 NHS]|uniref:DUF1349 domain-containing protein n=1 Tax=Microbacterium sp. 179-I 3D2 NHS TaxID=3235178 RepID=UPI0039A33329
MPDTAIIPWDAGHWTTAPASVDTRGGALRVTAKDGSDAWRHTAYRFVHDTEHALLVPMAVGEAVEVSFRAPWRGQFDQAGVFLRTDHEHWIKAGVEYADGHLGIGAVVTDIHSDWSIGQVDEWRDREISVRMSRWADAVIVRARADDEPWRLVRVAPFDGDASASAGPFLAAPTRPGLQVTFTRWERSGADDSLH